MSSKIWLSKTNNCMSHLAYMLKNWKYLRSCAHAPWSHATLVRYCLLNTFISKLSYFWCYFKAWVNNETYCRGRILAYLALHRRIRFWTAESVEVSFCPVIRCLSMMTCIPSGSLAEKEIMPEMEIFTIFPILATNIWKSYVWTTKKKSTWKWSLR